MHATLILITALLFGLSLWAAAWLARGRVGFRSSYDQGPQEGPVPGYAFYPGEGVALARWMLVAGVTPTSLEAFHSPVRSRVVLTVKARPDRQESIDTPSLLERATREMLASTGAHVAVIEISADPESPSRSGDWTAVASRDGRGWSGADREAWLVIEAPRRANGEADEV